jgi:uncharacterized phage protein (TIGR02218 family)
MTLDASELSNSEGLPLALFEFTRGTHTYRYVAADRDVTFDGNLYTATPIAHQGATQSGDTSQDSFEVELTAAHRIAQLYVGSAPSVAIKLTVRRWHYGDPDAVITWIGTVLECKQKDDATATLICQSLAATFGRNGLRLGWQRGCPHALYDQSCLVDRTAFGVAMTLTAVDGASVQAAEFALQGEQRFRAGYIEWQPEAGTFERRAIRSQVGEVATLMGTTTGLAIGTLITAYPGCAHTSADCDAYFGNLGNYGGFEMIPGKSPFDGDPVF